MQSQGWPTRLLRRCQLFVGCAPLRFSRQGDFADVVDSVAAGHDYQVDPLQIVDAADDKFAEIDVGRAVNNLSWGNTRVQSNRTRRAEKSLRNSGKFAYKLRIFLNYLAHP